MFQEREKQLETYEKKTPARPKSARVARSVLSRAPAKPDPKDEEKNKELEMRRAIANRLKAEMLGKQEELRQGSDDQSPGACIKYPE